MQEQIKKLVKSLADTANLNKNYVLQEKCSELHAFLNTFQNKNTKEARNFKLVLKSALIQLIKSMPDAQKIENTRKALETAWELRMRIKRGRVKAGKEKMKDAFFTSQWKQKMLIKKGGGLPLEDIMAFNKTMVDVLVDVYGEDRNTLPIFELPILKTQPVQKEVKKNSLGFMGMFNKLFESLSTPDGIVGFIFPLIGQVIDGIFSLFGGKRKTDPIAIAVKSAVEGSFSEALRQCKVGPEAHNQQAVFMPYFNLAQKVAKTHFPAVEQVIRNVSAFCPY